MLHPYIIRNLTVYLELAVRPLIELIDTTPLAKLQVISGFTDGYPPLEFMADNSRMPSGYLLNLAVNFNGKFVVSLTIVKLLIS
jgi:hypothetical protein